MTRRWWDGALLALSTFSVVPVRGPRLVTPESAGTAMLLAPLLGAGLGLAAGGAGDGMRHDASPLVGAVVAVALLAIFTRGLHLDGLADTTDGLASYRPPEAALGIMREGTVGPLGVVVLLLVVLLDVAALATTDHPLVAVVVAAGTGRLAATLASTERTPAARPQGLGAAVAGSVDAIDALIAGGVVVLAAVGLGLLVGGAKGAVMTLLALVVALVAAELLRWHAVRRLGGITGDVLGGLVEVATCLVLLVLATA